MFTYESFLNSSIWYYCHRKRVHEDYLIPLLTTHTPEFLGLRSNGGAWSSIGMGEGSIIGLLDTGIDVSHASFDDEGMKPPPAKWRGSCNFGDAKCNNKLIGGRALSGGHYPPEDSVGHGTHTASTAAGRSWLHMHTLLCIRYAMNGDAMPQTLLQEWVQQLLMVSTSCPYHLVVNHSHSMKML